MSRIKDLTGQRFGRLTALHLGENDPKTGKVRWVCQCDCGNVVQVKSNALVTGNTTSCGCYNGCCHKKHGETNTRLFNIWYGIKKRCCLTYCNGYKHYGGRGIKVCNEWLESFETFKEWALANGYQDNLSIDRIDVNGNYEPSNCRWTTLKQQANNKTDSFFVEYNGVTHTLKEWSEILNINYRTLFSRIRQSKWSIEKAFTTPVRNHQRKTNKIP